ncbi:hypothetical protein BE04_42695 [Sorangium cellulosum]|uniref:Peptidase C51 domain-containing protein n=1 Tax=Sorangium cellulosum TaxID=56 RepID=A0A150PJR8_SORCE|nr:hypothetical protein BE04_42695 [Sorangium cellulosum]
MASVRRRPVGIACLVLSCFAWLSPGAAAAHRVEHLDWAERLVDNIDPDNNEYNSTPSFITWAGVAGARRYANRTQCATFLTQLLKRSYGWTESSFDGWLGSRSPSAATYYDAIVDENGFERIRDLRDARAGDVMAIRYPEGESATGHVAILRRAPRVRLPASPLVAGTFQYEVSVVDSTNFQHGSSDSRYSSGGRWASGAGYGVMRLYTNAAATVVGHTWSTAAVTAYYPAAVRQVAIGRLVLPDEARSDDD